MSGEEASCPWINKGCHTIYELHQFTEGTPGYKQLSKQKSEVCDVGEDCDLKKGYETGKYKTPDLQSEVTDDELIGLGVRKPVEQRRTI